MLRTLLMPINTGGNEDVMWYAVTKTFIGKTDQACPKGTVHEERKTERLKTF